MARKPMVTRTIESTIVSVLCADVKSCELCNKEVTIAGTYKDDEKLLKSVKEVLETDELKCVSIAYKEVISELRGMSEQCFIEHSEVLPPRTKNEE